jgi:hypothetical protein
MATQADIDQMEVLVKQHEDEISYWKNQIKKVEAELAEDEPVAVEEVVVEPVVEEEPAEEAPEEEVTEEASEEVPEEEPKEEPKPKAKSTRKKKSD